MTKPIETLGRIEGVETYNGTGLHNLTAFEESLGFALPPEHSELLLDSNGVTVYYGYYRVFGVGGSSPTDVVRWNHPECWRFAWADRCSLFWCFGETGWGDQYAYKYDDLKRGGSAPVYFLEGLLLTPSLIAPSFGSFLHEEIARNAADPYDKMMRLAYSRFGPLQPGLQLVYAPPLLLGGPELIDNVQALDSVTAMILKGDLATQLTQATPGTSVKAVEPYQDEKQRTRLRLIWESTEPRGSDDPSPAS